MEQEETFKRLKWTENTMSQQVQNILKKINYIEADMEIYRQILGSIPSANREEMEETIKIIAQKKAMVEKLRQEINTVDPAAFDQILAFEKVTEHFKQLAGEKKFLEITTPNEKEECIIKLKKDDETIGCLVKAKDESGGYTIITFNGEILEFSNEEVVV